MGLFGKKAEAVIVFVGDYTDSYSGVRGIGLDKERFRELYKHQLHALLKDVKHVRVWYFDDWSSKKYRISTLLDVKQKGFSAFDEGEKKELLDEIEKVLILHYGSAMQDHHPSWLIDQGSLFIGSFCILCKLKIKEKKLQ